MESGARLGVRDSDVNRPFLLGSFIGQGIFERVGHLKQGPAAQVEAAPLSPLPPGSGSRYRKGKMPRTRRGGRRWLTYEEVAEISGLSPFTIRNATQRGAVPYRIVTWRNGHYVRRKRVILDRDALNWIYSKTAPRELLAELARLGPPGPPV